MVRTIEFLKRVIVLGSVVLCAASVATAQMSSEFENSCADRVVTGGNGDGGGDIVYPWGSELSFPWDHIQGIWKVQKGTRVYYFSFKRILSNRIFIQQFDVATCKVVGTGQGTERNKTVRSQIRNTMTKDTYNLTLAAFPEDGSPAREGDINVPYVMVARINSVNRIQPEFTVEMTRISDRLEFKCSEQDKKVRF